MIADRIVYSDKPGRRVLDLRPCGADCIPSLSVSDFKDVKPSVDFHYHPRCVEISLCLKGSLYFDTPAGKSFAFLPGNVFVSRPDEPHHLRECPSGLKVCSILFRIPRDGCCTLGLSRRGSTWLARALTHLPKRLFASTPRVRDAFERLFAVYDEVPRRPVSRSVRIRAGVLDLLVAVTEAARRQPNKAPSQIGEIAQRIRNDPSADYSIARLADETKLSRSSFALSFRKAIGLPLHAYLLTCRIDLAKKLLRTTSRTITSVGQELRFYSATHFARTFRRLVGIGPREYRTQTANTSNNEADSEDRRRRSRHLKRAHL